jgi:hypothetical protein
MLDSELEDAAVRTRSPIGRFAAASASMYRLLSEMTREKQRSGSGSAIIGKKPRSRRLIAMEPAGMRLILPAVMAAAVHERQPVSQIIENPAERPAGKRLLRPR